MIQIPSVSLRYASKLSNAANETAKAYRTKHYDYISENLLNHNSELMLTKIEPKLNSIILIMPIWHHSSMKGMCHRCYSSGVSITLDEESFEAVCDRCRNNSDEKK